MRNIAARDQAVWLLRLLWFVLPVTAGPTITDALAESADGTRSAIVIGAWVLWAAGLAASAVLLPVSLTVLRILSPLAVLATAWATASSELSALAVVGLLVSLGALLVSFTALVGDRFVDGASYGDERRMLLRPPTRLAFGVVPLTWAATAGGLIAGPLLLANRQWLVGAALALVGAAVATLGARALHQLNLRWIVFVPTGMVLHDFGVLTEPVLFRQTAIERLGVAIAGTPAKDLSNRAAGLLLECELADPAPLGLRRIDRSETTAELTDVRRFLFAPSRPGALLDEAERRRIAVD